MDKDEIAQAEIKILQRCHCPPKGEPKRGIRKKWSPLSDLKVTNRCFLLQDPLFGSLFGGQRRYGAMSDEKLYEVMQREYGDKISRAAYRVKAADRAGCSSVSLGNRSRILCRTC